MDYMWLSFVDEGEFLGAVLVEASDIIEAVQVAHFLGINPGGQVLAIPLSCMGLDEERMKHAIKHCNKLMSIEDLKKHGFKPKSVKEIETERSD